MRSSEKDNQGSDVFRIDEALQRLKTHRSLPLLFNRLVFCLGAALENSLDAFAADGARSDRVDANVGAPQFRRERSGETEAILAVQ